MGGLYARFAARFKEFLQAFVLETFYHGVSLLYIVTIQQYPYSVNIRFIEAV